MSPDLRYIIEAAMNSAHSQSMSPLRVSIVEDQKEIRESLAALIHGTPGFTCAGSFASMEAALSGIDPASPPHVALIDIHLPGISGIEGIRKFRETLPSICPLMLTVHDDDQRIMDALCAGANGYLLKNTAPLRLLEAIRESANGGSPMSPEIARRVVELFRLVVPPPKTDYELTPHESRILGLLVSGENYKTVATKLGVSVNTISYHVRNIYGKLQVHSRSEAVAKALRSRMF